MLPSFKQAWPYLKFCGISPWEGPLKTDRNRLDKLQRINMMHFLYVYNVFTLYEIMDAYEINFGYLATHAVRRGSSHVFCMQMHNPNDVKNILFDSIRVANDILG